MDAITHYAWLKGNHRETWFHDDQYRYFNSVCLLSIIVIPCYPLLNLACLAWNIFAIQGPYVVLHHHMNDYWHDEA